MSLLRLSLVVTALAVSVVLALTNPTTDQYLGFVQTELAKTMDRMDQSTPEREGTVVRNIFRRHSRSCSIAWCVLTPCVKIGESSVGLKQRCWVIGLWSSASATSSFPLREWMKPF